MGFNCNQSMMSNFYKFAIYHQTKTSINFWCGRQGRTQDFKLGGGVEIFKKKKISNTHPYSINKLSTKTNTQKSLFLNILRHNHLLTKTKDTKYYCFFIQSSMKKELDALSNLQNHLRLNPN